MDLGHSLSGQGSGISSGLQRCFSRPTELKFTLIIASLLACFAGGVVGAAGLDDSETKSADSASETQAASESSKPFNQEGAGPPSVPSSGPATDVRSVPHRILIGGKFPLFVSGYVQGRFTDEVGTKFPFRVKRARLMVDAVLSEWADIFVQLDPTVRPDIVLDAYLQLRIRPAANFRFGAFKVPFSGESVTADEKTIPIERSIVVNSLSPDRDNGNQARDVGAELLGHAGGDSGNLIEYSLAAVNGSGLDNVSGHHRLAGATRVIVHPIAGLSVGGDYFQGKTADASPLRKRVEEWEGGYKLRRLTSWAEYLWGNQGSVHRSGGYALLAYQLDHHWETFVRLERYDANHAKPGQITRIYEAGANYYVTNRIRVQANAGTRKDPIQGDLSPVFLVQLQIGL